MNVMSIERSCPIFEVNRIYLELCSICYAILAYVHFCQYAQYYNLVRKCLSTCFLFGPEYFDNLMSSSILNLCAAFLAQDEYFLPNQIIKKLKFVEVVWLKFQPKLREMLFFRVRTDV